MRGREGACRVFFRPVAVCRFNRVGQECSYSRKAVSQSSSAHDCVEYQAYGRVLFLFYFIFLNLSRTLWMVKALLWGSGCESKRKTHLILASSDKKKKRKKSQLNSGWFVFQLCVDWGACTFYCTHSDSHSYHLVSHFLLPWRQRGPANDVGFILICQEI